MFSLIVALISIALVAALAAATISYAGDTANRAVSRVAATELLHQAQQVLAAEQAFNAQEARSPDSIDELLDRNFLMVLPGTPAHGMQPAPVTWEQVQPGAPQYWLLKAANVAVCRAVNLEARGDNGIRAAARENEIVQCFGSEEPYTILAHVESRLALDYTIPLADPDLSADPESEWAVAPTKTTR